MVEGFIVAARLEPQFMSIIFFRQSRLNWLDNFQPNDTQHKIMQLVIRSKCRYEKNRCADAIVEAISLSASFFLLIAFAFPF
jgi:hypothetical protein